MGRAASVMTLTRIKLLQKLKALLKDAKPASSSKAANAFHKAHKALVAASVPDGDLQKLAQVSQELAGVMLHTAGCGDGATVIPCDQMKGVNSNWPRCSASTAWTRTSLQTCSPLLSCLPPILLC